MDRRRFLRLVGLGGLAASAVPVPLAAPVAANGPYAWKSIVVSIPFPADRAAFVREFLQRADHESARLRRQLSEDLFA